MIAARALSPTVPIVVRTRYRAEADSLVRMGTTVAVAEELEASLEVLAQLLARLDVPGNAIEVLVDGFRRDSTAIRRVRAPTSPLEAPAGDQAHADRKPSASGRRLGHRTNSRGHQSSRDDRRAGHSDPQGTRHRPSPPADLRVDEGPFYLLGDESDVLLARRRLTAGDNSAIIGRPPQLSWLALK